MIAIHPDLQDTASHERLARIAQEQIRAARAMLYQVSIKSPEVIDLVQMSDGQRVEALIRANCQQTVVPIGKYERQEYRLWP